MPHYAVYGSVLESELELPELTPTAPAEPRWRVRLANVLAPMQNAVERGAERIYDDVHARLFAHQGGLRITVDNTGAYDLAEDGTIVVAAHADAWPDFVRAHLLGRVLATALFESGWLPLHGSAVLTREGVIAFLAPKGFGKSSLALALTELGAPLVTDDLLPIEPTTPPVAWPGVHRLRVPEDAMAALAVSASGEQTRERKHVVEPEAVVPLATTGHPLAALFLLSPIESDSVDSAASVRRTPYSPVLAAAAVTAHVKIGAMLGRDAAAAMLARVANVVNLVPVHSLSVPRDLTRLPDAARTVLEWYGGPAR